VGGKVGRGLVDEVGADEESLVGGRLVGAGRGREGRGGGR